MPAFELMFHSSLFLRNFHPISASWMSPFRKVRCLSLAVSIFHLAKGIENCIFFSQYHDKRSFKRKNITLAVETIAVVTVGMTWSSEGNFVLIWSFSH